MRTVAHGSLGENFKFDWMRTPHTTVAVPVTAIAASKARSSTGSRFHIDRFQLIGSQYIVVVIQERAFGCVLQALQRDFLIHRSVSSEACAPQAYDTAVG